MLKAILLTILAAVTSAYSSTTMWQRDFAAIRGSIQGFRRGLYKDPRFNLDPKCLGDTTTNSIAQLMHPVKSHDPDEGTTIFYESLTSVYYILGYNDRYCGLESIFTDLYSHCFDNPKNPCAFGKVWKTA